MNFYEFLSCIRLCRATNYMILKYYNLNRFLLIQTYIFCQRRITIGIIRFQFILHQNKYFILMLRNIDLHQFYVQIRIEFASSIFAERGSKLKSIWKIYILLWTILDKKPQAFLTSVHLSDIFLIVNHKIMSFE